MKAEPKQDIPHGFCQCGCGQGTKIARQTRRGVKKGEFPKYAKGHHARHRLGQATEDEIIGLYVEHGFTKRDITRRTGACWATIDRILKKYHVPSRSFSEANRIYSLNERAFEHFTPATCYYGGFLLADGCVTPVDNSLRICLTLQWRDRAHVEKFRKFVGSGHPVKTRYVKSPLTGAISKQALLSFSSTRMANDLAHFGVIPRKSLVAQIPEDIPRRLQRHFFRGLVDGDGSLHVRYSTYWHVHVTLVASLSVAESFLAFAHSISPDSNTRVYSYACHGKAYRATVNGTHAVRLVRELYRDCEEFLDRKMEIAKKIMELPDPLTNGHNRERYKSKYSPEGQGWCSRCKRYLAISNFHKSRNNHNGLNRVCKECAATLQRERNAKRALAKPIEEVWSKSSRAPGGMSWCSSCHEFLPAEMFNKNQQASNGLHYKCRQCASKIQAEQRKQRLEARSLAETKRD